mmetsp:Transcript_32797/g.74026  ORF Transcript_32797/g.74026 Transcript_32797/m.74026 type:complete len:226 (-) Transcript_32797:728-1405(-)
MVTTRSEDLPISRAMSRARGGGGRGRGADHDRKRRSSALLPGRPPKPRPKKGSALPPLALSSDVRDPMRWRELERELERELPTLELKNLAPPFSPPLRPSPTPEPPLEPPPEPPPEAASRSLVAVSCLRRFAFALSSLRIRSSSASSASPLGTASATRCGLVLEEEEEAPLLFSTCRPGGGPSECTPGPGAWRELSSTAGRSRPMYSASIQSATFGSTNWPRSIE